MDLPPLFTRGKAQKQSASSSLDGLIQKKWLLSSCLNFFEPRFRKDPCVQAPDQAGVSWLRARPIVSESLRKNAIACSQC